MNLSRNECTFENSVSDIFLLYPRNHWYYNSKEYNVAIARVVLIYCGSQTATNEAERSVILY